MELLTPAIGLIFWMSLIFITVFLVLKKYAWAPILSALSERENEISSALKMAEETRAEMAKLKSDNANLVAEARKERDQMLKEAKDSADRIISESKDKAVVQGNKIMEDAREMMTQERNKMMAQIKKDVAGLSIEIAEKLLKKELSDKSTSQTLVDSLIAEAKFN